MHCRRRVLLPHVLRRRFAHWREVGEDAVRLSPLAQHLDCRDDAPDGALRAAVSGARGADVRGGAGRTGACRVRNREENATTIVFFCFSEMCVCVFLLKFVPSLSWQMRILFFHLGIEIGNSK